MENKHMKRRKELDDKKVGRMIRCKEDYIKMLESKYILGIEANDFLDYLDEVRDRFYSTVSYNTCHIRDMF